MGLSSVCHSITFSARGQAHHWIGRKQAETVQVEEATQGLWPKMYPKPHIRPRANSGNKSRSHMKPLQSGEEDIAWKPRVLSSPLRTLNRQFVWESLCEGQVCD